MKKRTAPGQSISWLRLPEAKRFAVDVRLPGIERELLALVVSVENRCEPCVLSHATALRGHGVDPLLVDSIVIGWRRAGLEPRIRTIA